MVDKYIGCVGTHLSTNPKYSLSSLYFLRRTEIQRANTVRNTVKKTVESMGLRQMEGLVSVLLGSADGVVQGGVNQFLEWWYMVFK